MYQSAFSLLPHVKKERRGCKENLEQKFENQNYRVPLPPPPPPHASTLHVATAKEVGTFRIRKFVFYSSVETWFFNFQLLNVCVVRTFLRRKIVKNLREAWSDFENFLDLRIFWMKWSFKDIWDFDGKLLKKVLFWKNLRKIKMIFFFNLGKFLIILDTFLIYYIALKHGSFSPIGHRPFCTDLEYQ